MATKYKTGDLYLEDTWSLKSMLGHNLDPQTRWSNVGFVLIEGDSTSNEQDVHVALLADGKFQVSSLDEVLRRPNLQGAAYRQLSDSAKIKASSRIGAYLRSLFGSTVTEQSSGFQTLLEGALATGSEKKEAVSTMGTRLDAQGRDLQAPGFVKGNPNNTRKFSFTPEDLASATLSQVGFASYDPQSPLSNFQEGGLYDGVYGPETPLFPRETFVSSLSQREQIALLAQKEVLDLVMQYVDAKPQLTFGQFKSQSSQKINDRQELNYYTEAPAEEQVTIPAQMSNYYQARRRQETAAIASDTTSSTQEQKIRQQKALESNYQRPTPSYK